MEHIYLSVVVVSTKTWGLATWSMLHKAIEQVCYSKHLYMALHGQNMRRRITYQLRNPFLENLLSSGSLLVHITCKVGIDLKHIIFKC